MVTISGPKSSNFILIEQERRRQEEERQKRLEEERKKIEEEKCLSLEKDISFAKEDILKLRENLKQLINKNNSDIYKSSQDTIERIDKVINKTIDRKSTILKRHLGLIRNLEKSVNTSIKKYKKLQDEIELASEYKKSDKKEKKTFNIKEPVNNVRTELDFSTKNNVLDWNTKNKKAITKSHSISFGKGNRLEQNENKFLQNTVVVDKTEAIALNSKKESEIDLNGRFKSFLDLVDQYLDSDFLYNKSEIENLLKSIQDIINDKAIDNDYKIYQIEIRKKAFLNTKEKYDKEIENFKKKENEFEDLYLTYKSICKMLNLEGNPYSFEIKNSEATIRKLRQEIDRLNKNLVEIEEAQYISDSINEIMEELGYDILAIDHLVTKNREIVQNIYEFEQGNVINVYTSDNGSLMFEVNGVKEGKELTSLEKLKIKEGMENFCPIYDVVKEKLREKGIVLTNENLLPAEEKYARAINLNNTTKSYKKEHKKIKSNKNKTKPIERIN